MTDLQLRRQFAHHPLFRGVFMRDALPPAPRPQEFGFLNLDSSDGPGTHWVAWFKRGPYKIYFDSYGADPPLELSRYLGTALLSTEKLQRFGTNYCGQLCVFVISQLLRGRRFDDVLNDVRSHKWTRSTSTLSTHE